MASSTRSKTGAAREIDAIYEDATGGPSTAVAGAQGAAASDAGRQPPAAPNATGDNQSAFMTEAQVASLLSVITRSQAEANRMLFENMMTTFGNQMFMGSGVTPPSPSGSAPEARGNGGSFAKCTARFDGRADDAEKLEAFLDSVITYKECVNVSDEHALRGLPILLVDDAAVWWRGVKHSVDSWDDAVARLRAMYGAARPAYKIFRQIFAREQEEERCDVFVCKVRALIAKLPYVISETMRLDIVYGLLNRKIRKRVTRESVVSLDELVDRVREVEESMAEATQG